MEKRERLVVIIDVSAVGRCRISGYGGTDEDWEYLEEKRLENYGLRRLGLAPLVRVERTD